MLVCFIYVIRIVMNCDFIAVVTFRFRLELACKVLAKLTKWPEYVECLGSTH